jgi:hypothetical protein
MPTVSLAPDITPLLTAPLAVPEALTALVPDLAPLVVPDVATLFAPELMTVIAFVRPPQATMMRNANTRPEHRLQPMKGGASMPSDCRTEEGPWPVTIAAVEQD